MNFIILFIISFIISVILTPILIKVAKKYNVVDIPVEKRKIHKKPVPYLGGVAIYVATIIVSIIGIYLVNINDQIQLEKDSNTISIIFIGSIIIFIMGLLDDIFQVNYKIKLLVQIIVSIYIVVSLDISIAYINIPIVDYSFELADVGYIVSIMWIIGIMNSINLMDGMDGLSGGISVIALYSIIVLSILNGSFFTVILAISLQGAILGFLVYNYPPARIFMGDTGSLIIGYFIGIISLLGYKNATFISFIVPIAILAIPILDTFFAIIRRTLRGVSWGNADSSHIHHKMIEHTNKNAALLLIYGLTAIFSFAAIIYNLNKTLGFSLLILSLVIFLIVAYYIDLSDARNRHLKDIFKNNRRRKWVIFQKEDAITIPVKI